MRPNATASHSEVIRSPHAKGSDGFSNIRPIALFGLLALMSVSVPGVAQDFRFEDDEPEHVLQSGSGNTGGFESASERFGAQCEGMIGVQPDHVLEVGEPLTLRIYVEAYSDPSLIVVGPDGVAYCDDDSHGELQPELTHLFEAGVYSIYVGELEDGLMEIYRIVIEAE